MDQGLETEDRRVSWSEGKLIGQKPPLKLNEIWVVRIRLQLARRTPELAFFLWAIDSRLRRCDLAALRVRDVARSNSRGERFNNGRVQNRVAKKTGTG